MTLLLDIYIAVTVFIDLFITYNDFISLVGVECDTFKSFVLSNLQTI